ncbi:unnamed protein product [Eruca vesicaria subsp. sativa]|uniref:HTH myb-type domain-containing protein n=1 Tax=Eruca vesicaria subsp. sativa TaxID=29727 RepID=A0ABC8IV15_ERUVS|nr:unnamed protein product [Eruca vesicaria subsp. sativa]
MREDDSDWFTRCEEDLPFPEDLIPLSQSLIPPHLALAFDIHHQSTPSQANSSAEFAADSADPLSSGATESARTLKRPRLVWTPQLHKRFVDAVANLGIKNAVPKTIMQFMSVEGLTRENVASHLQKYRVYLKRMQGGGGGGSDPVTDRLFASSPVPAHFLLPPSFVPVATLQQQQQQMVAVGNVQLQPTQFHQRQISAARFGSLTNGQFSSLQRMSAPLLQSSVSNYVDELESAKANNGGRTVLTLFPT